MFQWRANILLPIKYAAFSPDSETYVVHTQGFDQYWCEEYMAETGYKVREKHVGNHVDTKTAHVNWAQSKGFYALGIPSPSEDVHYRRKRICWIPDQVTWTEQGQIGDTHLVIISPTHGVIIMKAPQDVHMFGAHFTGP